MHRLSLYRCTLSHANVPFAKNSSRSHIFLCLHRKKQKPHQPTAHETFTEQGEIGRCYKNKFQIKNFLFHHRCMWNIQKVWPRELLVYFNNHNQVSLQLILRVINNSIIIHVLVPSAKIRCRLKN